MPAASLGKSQVASDSVEGDMKFLEKNQDKILRFVFGPVIYGKI